MSSKAILALCIAILIPVVSYILVKQASEAAEIMPKHYLLDSVTSHTDEDKIVTDSVWHKVANITLQNQLGDTVSLYNIQNKSIICDFFFTSCTSVCPKLTQNMVRLQRAFLKGGDPMHPPDSVAVQFVSFTIDPLRDSVQKLKNYADRFGIDHDNWWMLTGNKDSIYNFIFQELKVDKYNENGPLDPDFAHTDRFVLLDKNYQVRGYYNGLDTNSLGQLAKDASLLMLEKTGPAELPFDPVMMAIFFAITLIVVTVVITLIFRKRKEK